MLNTRELEKRWLKHKIKSYIPHVVITLSTITIILVIFAFINLDEGDKNLFLVDENKTQTVTQKQVQDETIAVETKPYVEIKQITKTAPEIEAIVTPAPLKSTLENNSSSSEKSLKLSPSLNFINKMQHSSLPYYNNEPITKKKTQTLKKAPQKEIVEEIQDLKVEETIHIPEEEVKRVTINRRNVADDIKHIIKRFKKNNNPALSLFVAKKYYELGDYHKAYNYALITNQINRDIEASWIVFSKSLVKLNEKEMAIKTLKEYISNSHSSTAQILLDEIISGKFK